MTTDKPKLKASGLKPGPELDALVAEHVFGVCNPNFAFKSGETVKAYYYLDRVWYPKPFSTDYNAAFQAVGKLQSSSNWPVFFNLECQPNGRTWYANFRPLEKLGANGESAPHAICVALLKALGVAE